jgi:hypothetical protein
MELSEFIKQNIALINKKITTFKEGKEGSDYEYNDVEIKNYLQDNFRIAISQQSTRDELINELSNNKYVKSKIEEIANKYFLYKPHLEKFYYSTIFNKVFNVADLNELTELAISRIESNPNINQLEVKFIERDLKNIINKSLFLASMNGFSSDLQNSEMGLRVANEGDSAQFLFIARAILAGFNCSNVDVRSSRYDAIIDVDAKLIRIQIKGITSSNNISFFDRDRGGQGIDHTHERNRGKRITSKDCDIYVAVDKQVGICYIIPMKYADSLNDEKAKNIKLSEVKEFLENWDVILDKKNYSN